MRGAGGRTPTAVRARRHSERNRLGDGLRYTDGFTRLWPTIGTGIAMVLSVVLLGLAAKSLPVGTADAAWTGVGAVGTAVLGIVLMGEPANAGRLVSLGLIVAGIVGLKLVTPA